MSFKKLLVITMLIMLAFSCKKKAVETDNLFKFRDYISFTTSGMTSVTSAIDISLADAIEGWEIGQQLSNNIVNISPHVEGNLTVANSHSLRFTPNEHLEPDTEYTVTVKLNAIYKNVPDGFGNYTFQFKTITPSFNVTTNRLQSYSKAWQY
jgi:hypothetical protein